MPPLGEPPHKKGEKGPQERESRRAFNTPENAQKAVFTGRACLSSLNTGSVWRHRTPHGEPEIKASLTLDGEAVVELHFSPEDGSLLPKGLHGIGEGRPGIELLVKEKLVEIPQNITVLDGAEFREPEGCWAVPLAHQGRIIAHLRVSADGGKVLPDKKAADELKHTAGPGAV